MIRLPDATRAQHVWGESWRIGVALLLGLFMLLAMGAAPAGGYYSGSVWFVVEAIAGLVSLVLLTYRRRWPVPVALVTIGLSAVAVMAAAPAAIAFISACTHRRARQIVVLSLAWVIAAMVFEFAHPLPHPTLTDHISTIVITVLSTAACIAIGLAIGARRELVASLHRQVAAVTAQEQARVQQARLGERSRIAREMHDVLAHRISLVAMHSGALAYRADLHPDEVRSASAVIRDNAELALIELREVLGVLREESSTGVEPPQPNLAAVRPSSPRLRTATARWNCAWTVT